MTTNFPPSLQSAEPTARRRRAGEQGLLWSPVTANREPVANPGARGRMVLKNWVGKQGTPALSEVVETAHASMLSILHDFYFSLCGPGLWLRSPAVFTIQGEELLSIPASLVTGLPMVLRLTGQRASDADVLDRVKALRRLGGEFLLGPISAPGDLKAATLTTYGRVDLNVEALAEADTAEMLALLTQVPDLEILVSGVSRMSVFKTLRSHGIQLFTGDLLASRTELLYPALPPCDIEGLQIAAKIFRQGGSEKDLAQLAEADPAFALRLLMACAWSGLSTSISTFADLARCALKCAAHWIDLWLNDASRRSNESAWQIAATNYMQGVAKLAERAAPHNPELADKAKFIATLTYLRKCFPERLVHCSDAPKVAEHLEHSYHRRAGLLGSFLDAADQMVES